MNPFIAASVLAFDLQGSAYGIHAIETTFTLDTQSIAFSNVSVLVDGQTVVAAPTLTGAYSFSTGSSTCPGQFCRPFLGYGSLSIWIDPQSFFFWQNIPTNGDLFASANLQVSQAYLFESGVMIDRWNVLSVSVTDVAPGKVPEPVNVPEPAPFALMLLGLCFLWYAWKTK
jgi:hypothetical protein